MVHANHHHHLPHEAREADPDVATAVSVVYVTASKTFPGPIAGYNTPTVAANNNNNNEPNFFDGGQATGKVQNAPMAASTAPSAADAGATASTLPLAVASSAAAASSAPMIMASQDTLASSALPSQILSAPSSAITSDAGQQTTMLQAVSPSAASSVAAATGASLANAQAAPTAAQSPVQTDSDSGMSSGGKAGLAIGIIAIIAILAAIGFFFYRRKAKNAAHAQQVDNEKSSATGGMARSASLRAPAASRLDPKAGNGALPEMNEKQAAIGGIPPVAAPTTQGRTPEPQITEKSNPFGDHAKLPETVPAVAVPKPLNVQSSNSRPTTAGSDKSSPTCVGAAKGPDGQPLNVYRVQLDFAPSMDDELELRQGQLVRMLHEYDDGWCLCVRLDRSQQGVVPRSCVSKMPVKPRPGPPPGKGAQNGSRPTTPQSAPRARANSNVPAPLNTSRPVTPQGPFGEGEYRARSNTAGSKPSAGAVSPTPSYDASMLSNSPNQSPPSSPESKQVEHKPTGPGQAV